jgi:hypothetical protein
LGTASWIATFLDAQMLARADWGIASATTSVTALAPRPGSVVASELGQRYLLRYMLSSQVGLHREGSSEAHYATPTPYAPEETVGYLALPRPTEPRPFALILDANRIERICGPQWVLGGPGIQYFLPDGFPGSAVVIPGGAVTGWELQVR